ANTSSTPRSGTISIGGKTFTINQAGTACVVTIGSSSRSFSASSGTGTVAVSAPGGCSWAATSSASWLKVMSGSNGSGNGSVSYSVSANSNTTSRNATLTIGGNTFGVTQQGAACTVTISPTTRSVGAAATSGTISVSAGGNCNWTSSPSDSWLT